MDRLRSEYATRETRPELAERYSLLNPANLFTFQHRQRHTVKLLRSNGIRSLDSLKILEIGCGAGGVMLEYLAYGASIERLVGVDLLESRLATGRKRLACAQFACSDAQALPFASGYFDVILIYTAFSSILDDDIRRNVASEAIRVGKPGTGVIMWYDFWTNPSNKAVRGVRMREIRSLFPGARFDARRVTLAPPFARFLAPLSWRLASVLDALRLLNTHYLVLITLPQSDGSQLDRKTTKIES